MSDQIGLKAILDDKEYNAGLKSYMAGIDQMVAGGQQMQKATSGTSKSLDTVSDDMLETARSSVDLAAKMYIVQQAFEEVQQLAAQGLELAKLGATAERIEHRFGKFADEIGGAEIALEAFQTGAGGAASEMEAMQSASMLLQMDLVNSAEEMEELVTIAVRLGDQTQSVTERTENFALMMANQSIPRLDSYGLSSGTVRARILELMEAEEGMTRETAFATAVREEAQKSLAVLGERVVDNAASFEIMEARMADAKVELGKKLAPAFANAIDMFGEFGDQAYMIVGVLGEFGGALVKLGPLLPAMGSGLLKVAKAMKSVNLIAIATNPALLAIGATALALVAVYKQWDNQNKKIAESAQKAVDAADKTSEGIAELIDKGGNVVTVFRETGDVTNKTAEAWNNMHPAAQALSGVFGAHSKILKVVNERNLEVIEAAMKQGKTYPEVIKLIDLYNSQIEDSAWHVKGFTEAKYNAVKAMENFVPVQNEIILGLLDYNQLLLDGEFANMAVEQSTHTLLYEMQAAGYATETLTDGMGHYFNIMEMGVPAVMDHGDALSRYVDAQDLAAQAAAEAADAEEQAVADTKAALEELVRAQDAAKEAAFRHRDGLLDLAEQLSGGVDAAAVYRAGLEKLTQMEADGLISGEKYLELKAKMNEQFGFTDEGGRTLAEGVEILGNTFLTERANPENYGLAIIDLNEAAGDGVVTQAELNEIIEKYETPAETAERKTREFNQALIDGENPLENSHNAMFLLKNVTIDSEEPTANLTARTGELEDGLEPMPEKLGDMETSIDDLSQALFDTQAPFDDLITRIYKLPEDVMIVAEAMFESGKALVRRLEDGIDHEWKLLEKKKEAMLNAFAEQFHSSAEPKDPASPLRGFFEKGQALVQVYIAGLESEFPELNATFERLFTFGGAFAGLGGAAAQIMSKGQRELQTQMRFIDSEMKRLAGIWGIRGKGRGLDFYRSIIDEISGGQGEKYFQLLTLREAKGTLTKEEAERLLQYRTINKLMLERNEAEKEHLETQKKILALQEAQQRLRFLEQQVKLLELIDKHGLDAAAILGGLKLGADAAAEDVLAAMTRAIEEIIKQAEEKFGISSPSKVFREYGQQMMRGMAMGIQDLAELPVKASQIMAQGVMQPFGAGSRQSTVLQPVNQMTTTIQAGGNTISTGMNEAEFETRVQRAVTRALRGY